MDGKQFILLHIDDTHIHIHKKEKNKYFDHENLFDESGERKENKKWTKKKKVSVFEAQ